MFAQTSNSWLSQASEQVHAIGERLFNWNTIGSFIFLMVAAFVVGRFIAFVLRRFNKYISKKADKSNNLSTVERLRRLETVIVISIALIRVLLFAIALYAWWIITHPGQQSAGLIGASAFFAILAGGTLSPVLRDLAYGSMMMTEHWFGVGDHVRVEPFTDMQGIVERVTLRSTRIRGLNGEVIWVNNQNIGAIRITPKGSLSMAIELFVSDLEKGKELIYQTNLRLPQGPLMMVAPLEAVSSEEVSPGLWHIRAIGQTAPSREWLLEKYALEVIQELDEKSKKPILKSEPISRFSDSEAERKFSRAVRNARKPNTHRSLTTQVRDVSKEVTKLSQSQIKKVKRPQKSKSKNHLIQ
ncbi:MAG: mechanosensitive ion channel family protein [Candidatus Saccharimonadales bacterium]